MGGSLWDRAYDTLKDKEPDQIDAYEDLLSRALTRSNPSPRPGWLFSMLNRVNIAQMKAPQVPNETDDVSEATNQIPQHDVVARREKLGKITEIGVKYIETQES